MANNDTGMGQYTAVQYQNVARQMQRFLNSNGNGNAGQPVNSASSSISMPQQNHPHMSYVPGVYQLMPSPSANYHQPIHPQMNDEAARDIPDDNQG